MYVWGNYYYQVVVMHKYNYLSIIMYDLPSVINASYDSWNVVTILNPRLAQDYEFFLLWWSKCWHTLQPCYNLNTTLFLQWLQHCMLLHYNINIFCYNLCFLVTYDVGVIVRPPFLVVYQVSPLTKLIPKRLQFWSFTWSKMEDCMGKMTCT